MAHQLTHDEDRHLHVEDQFAHFQRRRVVVAHQIADQVAAVGYGARAFAVGHAGREFDGFIASHVVDQADESVIQVFDVTVIVTDLMRKSCHVFPSN